MPLLMLVISKAYLARNSTGYLLKKSYNGIGPNYHIELLNKTERPYIRSFDTCMIDIRYGVLQKWKVVKMRLIIIIK